MRTHVSLLLVLGLAGCAGLTLPASTPADEHANHSMPQDAGTGASDRLNASPRHAEWIEVERDGKTIFTWVVYPEVSEQAPVVLVIHENRGLNDWARSMADQLAEAGFIAVAPDLLSSVSDTLQRTSDYPDEDAARTALGQLDLAATHADLQAVIEWAKTIPASNGKIVSAGFCWGGARAFQLATESDDLAASLVFYGTGPTDSASYGRIAAPVYGFYGGADERVNATIDASKTAMASAAKPYEVEIYDGAGHAFMRSGENPTGDPANIAARAAAWERMLRILRSI